MHKYGKMWTLLWNRLKCQETNDIDNNNNHDHGLWVYNNGLFITSAQWLREGSVAEWLGHRTWNPEVAGLSPALTTKLGLFLGSP